MAKKVIDVSKWNPIKDYTLAAKEVEGVIVRCGYRGLSNGKLCEDPLFRTHIKAFVELNIPVGIYFFTTAITEAEAREEADYAIALIESLGIKVAFPIAVDTEYSNNTHSGRSDSLSKDARTAMVIAFCKRVQEKGYTPMIYASESWFKYNIDYTSVRSYKKWVANYSRKPNSIPDNMIAWQRGSTYISGIAKPVDDNEWYEDFTSTYQEQVEESSTTNALKTGAKLNLKDVPCYASSATTKVASNKTGTYYVWSDSIRSGRIRITNSASKVGVLGAVTGWINVSDLDNDETVLTAGTKITLKSTPCYASSATTKVSGKKTGTFYIWSASVVKDRIRITNKKENVGKAGAITGWIDVADI